MAHSAVCRVFSQSILQYSADLQSFFKITAFCQSQSFWKHSAICRVFSQRILYYPAGLYNFFQKNYILLFIKFLETISCLEFFLKVSCSILQACRVFSKITTFCQSWSFWKLSAVCRVFLKVSCSILQAVEFFKYQKKTLQINMQKNSTGILVPIVC